MRKKLTAALITAVILFLAYLIGTGFMKETSAFIADLSVTEDGREITLRFEAASSAGYIRALSVDQHGEKMYIACLRAFGGINGSIGAKGTFTLTLDDDTDIIALYRADNCYEEALVKDESGVWRRTGA